MILYAQEIVHQHLSVSVIWHVMFCPSLHKKYLRDEPHPAVVGIIACLSLVCKLCYIHYV